MVKPNEAMLLPSEGMGFLAILGEFWSWEHPQPTSKERNLSKAKGMAARMTTKIASKMILTPTPGRDRVKWST